jgi:protein-L-isoaspartate(D-aspartate) O-methyltransferase
MPALMMRMLDGLRAGPGMRVLEIGTGTGYNSALLSAIVGETGLVATVDIDATLVAKAAPRLAAITRNPGHAEVIVEACDGAAGWPEAAPYDRLVATVGCGTVPVAWWNQLAADGRAVVPLAYGSTFPIAVLAKGERPGSWRGRYLCHANFVLAIGGDLVRTGGVAQVRFRDDVAVRTDEIDARADEIEDLAFFAALELADARVVRISGGDLGRRTVLGFGSVALDATGATVFAGNRLYSANDESGLDRVRAAISRWREIGRPRLSRYRLQLVPVDGSTDPVRPAVRTWTLTRGEVTETIQLMGEDGTDDGG